MLTWTSRTNDRSWLTLRNFSRNIPIQIRTFPTSAGWSIFAVVVVYFIVFEMGLVAYDLGYFTSLFYRTFKSMVCFNTRTIITRPESWLSNIAIIVIAHHGCSAVALISGSFIILFEPYQCCLCCVAEWDQHWASQHGRSWDWEFKSQQWGHKSANQVVCLPWEDKLVVALLLGDVDKQRLRGDKRHHCSRSWLIEKWWA